MTSPAPDGGDFPPEETLRSWVDGLGGDDEAWAAAAFTSLDRACRPLLVVVARTLVGQVSEAEDIVQDVLTALWAGRERLRIKGQVRSYLLAAIHHRSLNAMRWHGRVEDLPEESGEDGPAGWTGSFAGLFGPEAEVHTLELFEQFERALEGLSDRRRQALGLHLRHFTNEEIATFMGISRNAVKVLIYKTRRDLHEFLEWLREESGRS